MTGKRSSRFRAAVVWAAILGASATGFAEDPLASILSRAADAPLAVVAEPIGQESRWENGGIWTYTELGVRRSMGETVPPTILVRQRGGVVGNIGQRVSHLRSIDLRRPHLLLLWRDPETGFLVPGVGGVLPLVASASGGQTVAGHSLDAVWSALEGVIR